MNGTSLKAMTTSLALVGSLTLASCSANSQPDPNRQKASAGSAEAFARLFVGYHADYEQAESPAALADRSDLVVRGTIVSIDPGRTQIVDAAAGLEEKSIVAKLRVDEVLAGSLDEGNNGFVYLELPNIGSIDPATYDASLPLGAETLIYAVPSRPGDPTLDDPNAGRPAGQPMLAPVSPQGFWMESSDGSIEVLEGDSSSDPIEGAAPSSDSFPQSDE